MRKLKQIIDWKRFSRGMLFPPLKVDSISTRKLIVQNKADGVVGRSPFDPAQVLRVELIAYLYELSERQVEVHINENLPAKYFVGLAIDQKAPDHSTLTVFRERLIQRGKLEVFEEMPKMV